MGQDYLIYRIDIKFMGVLEGRRMEGWKRLCKNILNLNL